MDLCCQSNEFIATAGDIVAFKRRIFFLGWIKLFTYFHFAVCTVSPADNPQATVDQNEDRITIGVDTPRLLFSTQIVEKTIGNQNNEHGARVNNLDKAAELRGLRLLGPDVIVRRAREFLTDNLVYYNLLTRNCEHFATMCRYEEGFSLQVRDFCTARVRPNLSKFSSYLLRKLSCSQVDAMGEVVERVHQQD